MADSKDLISTPNRPSITIPPPRTPSGAFSMAGVIPSPMTAIVKSFFADNPDFGADFRGSFSQLLAGAMASLSLLFETGSLIGHGSSSSDRTEGGSSGFGSGPGLGFKQNRPPDLMVPVQTRVSPLFPISPGFTPSAFLNSHSVWCSLG